MFHILVGQAAKKLKMSRFAFHLINGLRYRQHKGKCMLAKRSSAGKDRKESKREAAAHIIDLFFIELSKKKKSGSHL